MAVNTVQDVHGTVLKRFCRRIELSRVECCRCRGLPKNVMAFIFGEDHVTLKIKAVLSPKRRQLQDNSVESNMGKIGLFIYKNCCISAARASGQLCNFWLLFFT
jgi:hypothetical protein